MEVARRVDVVAANGAMVRRRAGEIDIGTEMVGAIRALETSPTWDTRFNGYFVTNL